MIGLGTFLNAVGILVGGVLGLALHKQLSVQRQQALKILIGALVVFVGLRMTWTSLSGGFWNALKQLGIMLLALTIGNIVGKLLRIQKGVNRLGQLASEKLSAAGEHKSHAAGEGFVAGTLLFCVGPIAILGALQDGLDGKWQTLGVKGLMDGLATMALVTTLGWSVILAVVPVVAYQGTITLCARLLAPLLQERALMDSINATGGMLVFSLALIILEIRKVEVADYLPSLIVAPLLTWWWR
ncbi:MAG: DUF554 domain-containing protein [Verrucomicrobia subdivision 3 bacterium]|nr:DUF554 domain-containing protein [Limisphaerales bacterium]